MTPSEKADEIFNKYLELYPEQDLYFVAKLAAIIAVDEIINCIKIMPDTYIIYWVMVREELNNY